MMISRAAARGALVDMPDRLSVMATSDAGISKEAKGTRGHLILRRVPDGAGRRTRRHVRFADNRGIGWAHGNCTLR